MSPLAHRRLTEAMRQYRRDGARLAAMIVLAEPHRLNELATYDFLRQVPYADRALIGSWLLRAKVDPLTAAGSLSYEQRVRLAGVLAAYSKGLA